MRPDARILVIGPEPFHAATLGALPHCQHVWADQALSGIWEAGQQAFDGILLSFSAGGQVLRAVRSLREVAPQARLVVTCGPADEPHAREAVREGADEYVIEPVTREDLERALKMPALALPETIEPEPSLQEKAQFVDVIKNLSEGPRVALARMAELVRRTFAAEFVVIELGELLASAGDTGATVLQEQIRSQDRVIGRITLGRCTRGAYGAAVAARLSDYAQLVEAVVTVARERDHWQDLAWTDDLSRLRNRRYFEARLDDLLQHCARNRAHLTLLLLDIDNFKDYNDRFGHETGDALIREVAYLLTRCSREADLVARYGGDEFALVFWDADKPRVPGSHHPADPLAYAERFCQAIRLHNFHCLGPDGPAEITVSGGMASFPWDGTSREQLVRAADAALLSAKRTGKNRLQLSAARGAEPAEPAPEIERTAQE